MIVLLGIALGLGLLLVISPFVWPAGRRRPALQGQIGPAGRMSAALGERLAQAGLHSVSTTALLLVSAIAGLAAAALCFALVPVTSIALIAGLTAVGLPTLIVSRRARSRRRATRVLWPDVVDHLVSAVRSGLALPDGLVTLAHAGPVATREAFAAFERDYRATGNFGRCLDDLKRRLADPVADRILETLRMSREVGGSELTAVLRSLAAYLRQEAAIRAEVEARQSWVMNAAKLGVAAPWAILVLLASRPESARAYNSTGGVTVIVGGLVVTVIAYRLMLGLGRLREERRWFS